MLIGSLAFELRYPDSTGQVLALAAALGLGWLVGFGLRYLVALSAFWLTDVRGVQQLSVVLAMFFSGMVLPLVAFPGWFGTVARYGPWAAMVQTPADIWLGKTMAGPLVALATSTGWAVLLLVIAEMVGRRATRAVVVLGG